jgi:predicted amidophosphoribosyltransferase
MRSLLHLLKYEGMEPVAGRLGQHLATLVAAQPALPDRLTVVPVPLFAAKLRQRGYNQAELLARAVVQSGRQQGLAWTLDAKLLRRMRATDSQAGLTPRQRRANVRGAFFVPGSRRDPQAKAATTSAPQREITPELKRLQGLDILLIDDIYTTGATARAASIALREAGAKSVWVATVARAQRFETVPAPVLPMQQDVAFWN